MVVSYKIIILILFLQLFLINTASADNLNNVFDEINKTLIIKNSKTNETLITIQQVSANPDLATMEEIFKITSYVSYTFKKNRDFNIRWQKFRGKNVISNVKWEILETANYNVTTPEFDLVEKNHTISNIESYANVTDIYDANPWLLDWGVYAKEKWNITYSGGNGTVGFDSYEVVSSNPLNIRFFWNATEQTGSRQETRYRDEWKPFLSEGRTIKKGEAYFVKLTFYKQAETGKFSIKTIPMFAGIEEDRLTWWNGSWNYRIDNPIPDGTRPYQLSLNISNSIGSNNATHVFLNSHSSTNFADIRFTLDNTTPLSYWIENDATGKVWVNVTGNGTVNLYYGNPLAYSSSDGKKTFEFFDDFVPESWQKLRKRPQPLADGAGAVLNARIYTIGGYNLRGTDPRAEVWAYDPVDDTYSKKANLNYARWGPACTAYSGNIYCFGGTNRTDGLPVNLKTEKYDPVGNKWLLQNSDLPSELQNQGLGAVTGGAYIYLFYNNFLFRYDPAYDSYIRLNKPPNYVLSWQLMAFYNNEIYLIGGFYKQARNYVQIYNITTNAWRTGTPMPVRLYGSLRENPVVNGNIYVLQGQSSYGEFFSRYWIYNISSNSWSWGELGYWDADGVAGGVVGNKIYTFGGRKDGPFGTDFAGVLDTTKSTPAKWVDRVTGNWRVDNSALTIGLQVNPNPTAQLKTVKQVLNTNTKTISRMQYLVGSSGYGGLTTHSNGGIFNSDNNGYIDPWIGITAKVDQLLRETGNSFTSLGTRSPALPDVWYTYITNYDKASIRSTRNGKDGILAFDGTYRGGYIQVIKTRDLNLLVDYIAVARYVTPEPTWATWSEERLASSVTQPPGLIAYWNLNEGSGTIASDSSGNGNTGTINGATWTTGKVGSALSFNGLNNYVDAGKGTSLNINSEITLMAWIKTTSTSENVITGRGLTGWSDHTWGHTIENGHNTFYWANGYSMRTADYVTGTKPVNDGKWHHVAARANSTHIEVYTDGVYDGGRYKTTKPNSNTNLKVLIGNLPGYSLYFKGTIDEVKIYNRSLSASEILADYSGVAIPDITPSISISSPSNGATVSGITIVNAIASDDKGISRVEFYIDNILTATDTTLPYSYSWNTSQYSNGLHTVKATAFDTISQSSSYEVSVSVNNAVQSSGLVAYWNFNESSGTIASDSSGSGNNGAINGATWTTGKIGSALSFNGLNNYIDAGKGTSLNINSEITLMAWIKTTSTSENVITGRGLTGWSDHTWGHTIENGRNTFYWANGYSMRTADYVSGTKLVNDGEWHHVAARANSTHIEVYTDGVYDGGRYKTTKPNSNTNLKVLIGNLPGYSLYFSGTIDEVKIYNRSLSASEINDEYLNRT